MKKAYKDAEKGHKAEITYDEDDRIYNIYITDEITGPEDYTNVFDTFVLAKENETIRVFLATPGGRLDTTNKIRGLALMTRARTIAVVGDVASAGTILALCFDEMVVLPNIEFMIHNYSGGARGKGHEVYSAVNFLQKEMPRIFKDYYDVFLTDEEIADVIAGNDLYLNSDEVAERWERKVRHFEQLLELEQIEEQKQQLAQAKTLLEANGYIVKNPSSIVKDNPKTALEKIKDIKVKPKKKLRESVEDEYEPLISNGVAQ